MNDLIIRPAAPTDLDFIVAGVMQAERTSLPAVTTYEVFFGLSCEEAASFVRSTLLTVGAAEHPLSLASFVVAESGGQLLGMCSAWCEAAPPSGAVTSIYLSRFLGADRWRKALGNVRVLSAASPTRSPGSIQVESVYVAEAARGIGLAARVLDAACNHARARNQAATDRTEIQFFSENTTAERAYIKGGFRRVSSNIASSEAFSLLSGSRGFTQLYRISTPRNHI